MPDTNALDLRESRSSDSSEASSGSDEPFDVQRAHSEDASSAGGSQSKMRRKHATNEVGELPALSLARSEDEPRKSRMLSGRRTLRPLSPPSRAGLQDRDDTEDESACEDEEEMPMPMDERKDYKRQQQAALCAPDEGVMGMDTNYCLTAIEEMCGVSPKDQNSPEKKKFHRSNLYSDPAKSKSPRLRKVEALYETDEQTAIEVEYVEPERQKDSKSDVSAASSTSPRKKNLLVQAMAKRARQDFEKFKGKSPEGQAAPAPPDNVYSSFNPSEKRKFLKLINSGLTPSDATNQVLKERAQGEKDMEQVEEGSSTSKNSKSRLAFWKRNKDSDSIPNEVGGEKSAASASSAKVQTDEERFAKSGINYYDAVRKERPQEDDGNDSTQGADDEVAAATKKKGKSKGRLSKFVNFGFQRLSTREELANQDDEAIKTPEKLGSPYESPEKSSTPQSVEEVRAMAPPPPPPGQPASTALDSVDAEPEDIEEAAARTIFKPIPVLAEAAVAPAIEASMSDDSLLRDDDYMAPPEEKKEDTFKEEDMEDRITAQLLGSFPAREHSRYSQESVSRSAPVSQESSPDRDRDQASPEPTMEMGAMDLDVDTTYMNSTEIMSSYGGNSVADHASVVSGKSYKTSATSYTAGTNYTQSTRTRRPGAAKQRLAAAKQGGKQQGKKYAGWQESIQEAATNSNRIWDPKTGWIDYVEPDHVGEGESEEYRSEDKIVIPVDRFKRAQPAHEQGEDVKEAGESVKVPFPSTWKQERSSMLEGAPDSKALQEQAPKAAVVTTRAAPITPSRSAASSSKPSTSPLKPRGWVETMKEATARINTEGKRWDPHRGWIGLEEKEIPAEADRYGGSVSMQTESDTADFGPVAPARPPQDMPAKVENKHDPSGQLPVHETKRDPTGQWRVHEEDPSVNSGDNSRIGGASTRSGKSDRYIQIGDTGSVKSYYPTGKSSKTPQKLQVARDPQLATTPEMFGKMDEARKEHGAQRSSLLVNVVKERVDRADASLFPEQKGRRSSGPVDLDEIDDQEHNKGPVDLDEIDDHEHDSFDAPQDFSWDEGDTSNVSSMLRGLSDKQQPGKQAVPRLQLNIRDAPSQNASTSGGQLSGKSENSRALSEVSYGSSISTSSKSIPRLRGPKRDTSPIRGRKSSSNSALPQPENVSIERQAGPDPVGSQGTPQIRSVDSRSTPGESPPGYGPNRASKTPTKSPSEADDAKSSFTADSSPSVNSVKKKAQYWETKLKSPQETTDHIAEFRESSTQSNEWKSFLSKKVQAESAAAAVNEKAHPLVNEDRDSLFDFPESEGAFPSAHRGRVQRGEKTNSLRSLEEISDLSPIRTVQDEDDDDEVDEEETPSEVSSSALQGTTFLQRLQACAAPIMPKNADGDCNSMPMAHLAFLRTNPAASGNTPEKQNNGRFVPPNLCGRPDVIVEESEDEEESVDNGKEPETRQKREKGRSISNPRSSRQSDVSSVISDDFGTKTAYFEAIAMKAAVSGSKKGKRRSTGSDVSGSSSKHSEKWQRFLDKKSGNESSPSQELKGNEQLSQAAEKYAAGKVDEMMEMMAQRSQSKDFQARPVEEATGAFPSLSNARSDEEQRYRKSDSARAAEDLAAARVEAMMHSLSSQNLDEEGEI